MPASTETLLERINELEVEINSAEVHGLDSSLLREELIRAQRLLVERNEALAEKKHLLRG